METIPSSLQPRYQALLQLLRAADTLWNASRILFERWDLSPSQFNILNLLHLNPEGSTQSDLGRQLVMHRSNVTGLVDRLEKRGLVRRTEVAGDRRSYNVTLTAPGRDIMAAILPLYYEGAIRVWQDVPEKRIQSLLSDLHTVAQKAESIARDMSNRA
jgi:MarR family 2-MHQ and catechol resistance regulon transcriptional repressor